MSRHPDNPFGTPALSAVSVPVSLPAQSITSQSLLSVHSVAPRRRFKSSRLVGDYEQPWKSKRDRRLRWDPIIFCVCIVIGIGIVGYLCYKSYMKVPRNEYCLILDDNFDTLNSDVWTHEVQVDGFGTGTFDWTTDDPANSYTDAEGLHIVPTLTLDSTNITADQLVNGYTVNLTADGTCTAVDPYVPPWPVDLTSCTVSSNLSHNSIINPVRSARLTTQGKKTIKYGRVIVEAKMPKGDWLWPAIWMMPQDSVYGPWPRSGEIDIAETRGNDPVTYPLGANIVNSALHWGTAAVNDQYLKTSNIAASKRAKAYDAFHTYGLEWNEKYIFSWEDDRLRQINYVDFTTKIKSLWTFGNFAGTTVNGTAPDDPWSQTGRANTPFDEDFYLILNVAVGGTNGYFADGLGNKPWGDSSRSAMSDFWMANQTWLKTWGEGPARGMTVRRVQMFQQGACS